MILGIFIGIAIALALVALILWWQKQQQPDVAKIYEQHAKEALGTVAQDIVKITRDQLGAEKRDIAETISKDLLQHTNSFKEVTFGLKQEIDKRQQEIRQLEEDRNKKYGQIAQALTDYKTLTEELRGSTQDLKRILANNQLRGSWGELQAEKILEAAGMINGQHYVKQQTIEGFDSLKPDFTLYLPNQMELFVDVKFPLQALQLALTTEDKAEQTTHLQQFGNDLKARIKEAGKYVIDKPNCCDYVILFVPSESVFEIINKHFSAIIDSSFSQQVILVSPHSFFAVVRTIQESYTHFYYEQNLKENLVHLKKLLGNFELFKTEFGAVGDALGKAQDKYNKIAETRYKQIASATKKINEYKIDKGEEPLIIAETIPGAIVESTEDPVQVASTHEEQ